MVNHGKTKKRRAGRIGRTKIKNRTYTKFRPPQIKDHVIKSKWDPTISPAQNLRNLGLTALPNSDINSRGRDDDVVILAPSCDGDRTTKSGNKFVEMYGNRKEATPAYLPVSIEEQKFIVRCFAKYGIDYGRMARDIRVNDMQHTEEKLKKIGDRFMLLTEQERRVDVPESVQHLVA